MVNNVAVRVVFIIVHNVMSLAAEAEIVALYLNAEYGVFVCNTL